MDRLVSQLESILFVATSPATIGQLAQATNADASAVEAALGELDRRCQSRGVRLQRQSTGYLLVTAPENAAAVEGFLGVQTTAKLSAAALETLAVIAYHQPATRAVIESIRGVNSDRAVATLQARGLIEEVGRAETAGRPVLLGTTPDFLLHFGLASLQDLPPIDGEDERKPASPSRDTPAADD